VLKTEKQNLFKISVEEVTVLVQKTVHIIRHWAGIMDQTKLLANRDTSTAPSNYPYLRKFDTDDDDDADSAK